ncbi:hypothetical protein SCP_0403320 [Sparassis crispa]|uniref:Uncharacterized protein n=1 Tax=Sparassis crispa TaxID=139825 RepID=A0A401GIE4_9APHY|nr:hypothetical protein SCP_0403320 [Sparassis crispa]GBE81956.1 hypothetical protein SCP_0403320 [Sparassis crispa]
MTAKRFRRSFVVTNVSFDDCRCPCRYLCWDGFGASTAGQREQSPGKLLQTLCEANSCGSNAPRKPKLSLFRLSLSLCIRKTLKNTK